ncbi:VWA domain-containing protein [Puniceicoccaceae bacterium K14]|nr:VWA domain-containing protein [Puniceicoccaceae bacterium K14]
MENKNLLSSLFRVSKNAFNTIALCSIAAASSYASGILTPVGSPDIPLKLDEHHVRVVINNGFAHTEVEQVFRNPNTVDLEAIYQTPIPEQAALSELRIELDEKTIHGEVIRKEDADRIYEEEKKQGNDAGKATQNSYQNFEFNVSRVPANGTVRMFYSYYEALKLDTGIGRYAYRIEEGGTDEQASAFWSTNELVESQFSLDVTLNSVWPVTHVRTPHFNGNIQHINEKNVRYSYTKSGGQNLNQDFVFYYKLQENLPGRLEMITYRPIEEKPGTFMLLMTPGDDLEPLKNGSDYVFVVDVSGSMNGKLHTLANGVSKAIEKLRPEDRYRIIPFNNRAWDIHKGWLNATPENIHRSLEKIHQLQANNGTNLYNAISAGIRNLDSDRVSSLILVTDGVANQGIVNDKEFYKLLHAKDVRFFGFLLGNSSNWPLMRLMCEASGGYYKSVSNSNDIIGEILLAKNKVAYQSMHEASLKIKGVDTFDVSDFRIGKIHRGEQLIFFGKYNEAGQANIELKAKISGHEKTYTTQVEFPSAAADYPEIERMWALDQVQKIQVAKMAGLVEVSESEQAIADIGIAYQIVTEGTSMIALDDEGFMRHGIERKNQQRLNTERMAQTQRVQNSGAQRVDSQRPMYTNNTPSHSGGGAIEPWLALLIASSVAIYLSVNRKKWILSKIGLCTVALALSHQSSSHASVHDSISNFWEVSESEANLYRKPGPKEPQNEQTGRSQAPLQPLPDKHTVKQNETANKNNGHFGFNLFGSFSLFEFVWGDQAESQENKYEGTVKR